MDVLFWKERGVDNNKKMSGGEPSDLPILAQQINRFVEA
ncbi:hypothetical protein CGI00_02680 [Vibrio parahaemolyticus]|nr:hypothetical protein CGI00_02680 [Vibrio parahaemolyticus]TOL47748.1 hypothetical protein CGH97_16120 [Vibrio parahaemolyticus]